MDLDYLTEFSKKLKEERYKEIENLKSLNNVEIKNNESKKIKNKKLKKLNNNYTDCDCTVWYPCGYCSN